MKGWETRIVVFILWGIAILDICGFIKTPYEYLKFIELGVALILSVLSDIQDKLDKLNK